jgi:AraC family transcriptional regulator of adaptative response/methylated-DNA-[protein]-cysteine methyltransferase
LTTQEKIVFMMILEAPLDTQFDQDQAWQQLLARDRNASFFYAVTTTGVFCRPGCASRAPLRANTRFFATTEEAKAGGFRPCQRCRPEEPKQASPVARMCAYLEQKIDKPVQLSALGELVRMSPFTAQRLFKQAMGVTPAQYQRALRANALRTGLRSGADVTSAIYEAGYGSSSRAYEPSPLGMTPGRFLAGGRGENIRFAFARYADAQSPSAGWVIVASTERGICWVALGASAEEVEASLRVEFPEAALTEDRTMQDSLAAVVKQMGGATPTDELPLDLRGTAFQLRVWKALQEIPAGETRSYSQLAAELGNPDSTRAVARACATNRVAVLVPCHRVVGAGGSLTGYRWGLDRKRHLLKNEGARLA